MAIAPITVHLLSLVVIPVGAVISCVVVVSAVLRRRVHRLRHLLMLF